MVISLGGLTALIILSMAAAYFSGIKESDISDSNLAKDWFVYRVAIYVVFVSLWSKISIFLTRPRFDISNLSSEELTEFTKNRKKDIEKLTEQWWKVALLFAFFEIVMVQKLGL